MVRAYSAFISIGRRFNGVPPAPHKAELSLHEFLGSMLTIARFAGFVRQMTRFEEEIDRLTVSFLRKMDVIVVGRIGEREVSGDRSLTNMHRTSPGYPSNRQFPRAVPI